MTGLLVVVEAEVPGCDLDEGGAALGNAGGVPARQERADPLLLLGQRICRLGVRIAQLPGDEPLQRLVLLAEEGAAVGGKACRPALMVGVEPRRDLVPAPLVRHGRAGEYAGGARQALLVESAVGACLGEKPVRRGTLGDAEPGAQRPDRATDAAMTRDQRSEPIPFPAHVGQQGPKALLADDGGHGGESRCKRLIRFGPSRAQQACARRAKQRPAHALVGDLEVRRDARLQRKTPQQRLEEGVDGRRRRSSARAPA